MTESQLNTINYLTETEYEAAKEANNINENELYITEDAANDEFQSIAKKISGTILFEGILKGGNYVTINNLQKYKKLEITWGAYVNNSTPNANTGGVSNILYMNLEKNLRFL